MKPEWKHIWGLLVLFGSAVLFPTIGAGQLYKWTDAQGNLHITDVPPPMSEKALAPKGNPAPQVSPSPPPQKNTVVPSQRPAGGKRDKIVPVPTPATSPQSPKKVKKRALEPIIGLKPEQATIASPWEVLDGKRGNAKVGVQRWKDGKGIDHFSDVMLPGNRGGG